MATFFRLIFEEDKEQFLKESINKLKLGLYDSSVFTVNPGLFSVVPTAPFSYWVSDEVRNKFSQYKDLTNNESMLTATKGLATTDDFRFIRTKWETSKANWLPLAKGGDFSPYYADLKLKINWEADGKELKAYLDHKIGKPNQWSRWINAVDFYKKPGLTWPNATTSDLSARVLPRNCIISHMAPTLFIENDSWDDLSPYLAIMNSKVFKFLVSMSLGLADTRKHYEVGVVQKIPVPDLSEEDKKSLSGLALKAYENLKFLDLVDETSAQFLLPEPLLKTRIDFDRNKILQEVERIQGTIDIHCFELFDISEADKIVIQHQKTTKIKLGARSNKDEQQDILSWLVGVSFGRFSKSKAEKVNNGAINPFEIDLTAQLGQRKLVPLLTEDELLENIAVHLTEQRLDISIDVDKFINKDFFDLHLKKYTDSRRQAPVYWQLSSYNNNFSFWLYFHSLNSQSLVMCINDKIEPYYDDLNTDIVKFQSIEKRSLEQELKLEKLLSLSDELERLKQELLEISMFWSPNQNDGIQINAAPFWRLFRNKSWQKKLKRTWEQLQEGDYDWAHLAFSIWPERVLKKCHTDRSLAIAHDVENDLWYAVEVAKKNKKDTVWEWQSKPLSNSELHAYIKEKIETDERLKLYRSNHANNANGSKL